VPQLTWIPPAPLEKGGGKSPFSYAFAHARKGYRGIRGIFAEQVYRERLFKRPLRATLGSQAIFEIKQYVALNTDQKKLCLLIQKLPKL
jgi:hypothetical protein